MNGQNDGDEEEGAIGDLAQGQANANALLAGNANAPMQAPVLANANENAQLPALANEANGPQFEGAQHNEDGAAVGGDAVGNLQAHYVLVLVQAPNGLMVLAWVHPAFAHLFLQVA